MVELLFPLNKIIKKCYTIPVSEIYRKEEGTYMRNIRKQLALTLLFACVIVLLPCVGITSGKEKKESLSSVNYEVGEGAKYQFAKENKVTSFAYSNKGIGSFYIQGLINDSSEYNGVKAYGTSGIINFGYDYGGGYNTDDKTNWNLAKSGWFKSEIKIGDEEIKTSKNIDNGAIVVQKSTDGNTWENVASLSNAFGDKTSGRDWLYTTTEDELKQGTFYRAVVAYTMKKQIEPGKFLKAAKYDERTFAEIYTVFLCSDDDYCEVYDLSTRTPISLPGSVSEGFYIKSNDSSATIKVQKDNDTPSYPDDNTTYNAPGKYTITFTTKLKKEYVHQVTINKGVNTRALTVATYDCGDNKGYKAENRIDGTSECCSGAHFSLYIGQSTEDEIVPFNYQDFDAYGIHGKEVNFYAQLSAFSSGWTGSNDSWGKKEKETVDGVKTGEVASGALVIQKSYDGVNWYNIDSGRYAQGLYTTDFETHYGTNGKVLIYEPSGEDVIFGTFYRVLYAYEVKNGKKTKNYLEEYKFYLCNASMDAVVIHNLTVKNNLNKYLDDVDDCKTDLYTRVESMKSGSYTSTGFEIDRTLNKTAAVSVKKEGEDEEKYINDVTFSFTETGKYTIAITSMTGKTKTVIIYVDTTKPKDIYSRYFGETFISGNRVYSEGEYPTFEGGFCEYNICEVSSEYCPIYGTIRNKTTGTEIPIKASYKEKQGVLKEPGEYEAVFSTNSLFETDEKSGDNRKFTFHFNIIPEGTAPGPQINQNSLKKYAISSMTDSYPLYYGVTYQSAGKGYITLAFATKEDASNYAYNYEKGMVEQQSDGSYRYTGSFLLQKTKYESDCDLTDAIYYFVDQAVERYIFDLSEEFTYLTLEESVLEENKENYRKMELDNSVILFGEGQREKLTANNGIPIINDKKYAYVVPEQKAIDRGVSCFEFVQDKYKCDSDSITIKDENGKEYNIEYKKSAGLQLEEQGCPSGEVTIYEENVYGNAVSYNAIYIQPNDNTSEVSISYKIDGVAHSKDYTQNLDEEKLVVDEFTITSFTDPLDKWAYVTVNDGKTISYFISGETDDTVWSLPGEYEIKCVNRLGYSFSFCVQVKESNRTEITFSGIGSDDLQSINTEMWAEHVELPTPSRYGYKFMGYSDKDGNMYTDEMPSVFEKGTIALTTNWKPLQFTMTIVDAQKTDYIIEFGREIQLPKPMIDDGYEFVAWTLNGEKYNGNSFTLDTEADVTFVAEMKKIVTTEEVDGVVLNESNDNNSDNTENPEMNENLEEAKKEKTKMGIIVCFILLFVIVGSIIVIRISRKKKSAKTEEMSSSETE